MWPVFCERRASSGLALLVFLCALFASRWLCVGVPVVEVESLGIIDSLSAGYRFVGRKLYLIAIPVLLDLLLWLAPRFSIAPLLERLAQFYGDAMNTAGAQASAQLAGSVGDVSQMAQMTAEGIRGFGSLFNLLSALVSSTIMHVPSLVAAWALPVVNGAAIEFTSGWAALGLWLLLLLAGLFLGVLFIELLAGALPLGASPKPAGVAELLRATVRHWGRVIRFVLIVGLVLLLFMIPYSLFMGLLVLIVPSLAFGIAALSLGIFFVVLIYLYFVTAAIVVDDMRVRNAIVASMTLVRSNLLRVIGFVVLINVISIGIGLLLNNLAAIEPAGTLAAILINAYIGTGLAMALLVFYRSRLIVATQAGQPINLEP